MYETDERILSILTEYDIGEISGITSCESGTRNKNYEIWCAGRKKYFLREREGSSVIKGDIEYDHSLMSFFSHNDIVTPSPVLNIHGKTYSQLFGNYYELTKYIDGKPFIRDKEDDLKIAGEYLAKFHIAGNSFKTRYPKSIPRIDPPGPARNVLNELFQDPDNRRDFPEFEILLSELDNIEKDLNDNVYRSLPQVLIHGDFHPGNVKFLNGGKLAFFDLDWVSLQPRLQDLAYGSLFFASSRKNDIDPSDIYSLTDACEISLNNSLIFLSSYHAVSEISSEELNFLPSFIKIAWICCRTDGSKKVISQDRLNYFKRDILKPIKDLDKLSKELINRLYPI